MHIQTVGNKYNLTAIMDSHITKRLLVLLGALLVFTHTSYAQTTSGPLCTSTGHRCITLDQCATLSLANGQYQYCGDCKNYVNCQGGVGSLFPFWDNNYQQWDDNRKSFETVSTTCVECYYPCPPGPSAPTETVCAKTGLGCLTTACPGSRNGNFQYCGNCYQFVTCSGTGGTYTLNNCPSNTVYDDFQRTCIQNSTSCRECYDTCYPPTTVEPTTVPPTDSSDQPGGPSDRNTTDTPGGPGAGGHGSTTSRITLFGSFLFCFISSLGIARAALYTYIV